MKISTYIFQPQKRIVSALNSNSEKNIWCQSEFVTFISNKTLFALLHLQALEFFQQQLKNAI